MSQTTPDTSPSPHQGGAEPQPPNRKGLRLVLLNVASESGQLKLLDFYTSGRSSGLWVLLTGALLLATVALYRWQGLPAALVVLSAATVTAVVSIVYAWKSSGVALAVLSLVTSLAGLLVTLGTHVGWL